MELSSAELICADIPRCRPEETVFVRREGHRKADAGADDRCRCRAAQVEVVVCDVGELWVICRLGAGPRCAAIRGEGEWGHTETEGVVAVPIGRAIADIILELVAGI